MQEFYSKFTECHGNKIVVKSNEGLICSVPLSKLIRNLFSQCLVEAKGCPQGFRILAGSALLYHMTEEGSSYEKHCAGVGSLHGLRRFEADLVNLCAIAIGLSFLTIYCIRTTAAADFAENR